MFVISLKGLWRPIVNRYPSAAGALADYHHLCEVWCSALIALSYDGASITYAELCALAQAGGGASGTGRAEPASSTLFAS